MFLRVADIERIKNLKGLVNDTIWLSVEQMAELFQRDRSVIGKHIRNVFKEGELKKESVWAKFAHTADDGKTYQVIS